MKDRNLKLSVLMVIEVPGYLRGGGSPKCPAFWVTTSIALEVDQGGTRKGRLRQTLVLEWGSGGISTVHGLVVSLQQIGR